MHQNPHNPSLSGPPTDHALFFRFSLTYEEARETFLLVIDHRSPAARRIMSGTLLLAAVLCVYLYAMHPYGLQFSLMALLFALFSFLVHSYPSLKAGRAARAVVRQHGIYELTLSENGCFILPGGKKLALNGDSRSRAFETDTLFAIRPDRFHTICIPRRCVPVSELERVRRILKTNVRTFHNRTSPGKTTGAV